MQLVERGISYFHVYRVVVSVQEFESRTLLYGLVTGLLQQSMKLQTQRTTFVILLQWLMRVCVSF
jgi:hypothetical protein